MSFLEIDVTTRDVDVDGAVRAVIDDVLSDIVDDARASMETPKTGIWYPKARSRSSAPGEAPAIQSTELYAAIGSYPTADGGMVVASSEHAGFMEHGTIRGIEPRPFMAPAARKAIARHAEYELELKERIEG